MMFSRSSMIGTFLLAALIYCLSLLGGAGLGRLVKDDDAGRAATGARILSSVGSYTLLIAASLALTAGLDRRESLGLARAKGPWGQYVLYALLAGCVTTIAIKLSPGKGMGGALQGMNPAVVGLIVLYSSFSEEIFTRGWFQGRLAPFRDRNVRVFGCSFSVPVVSSGGVFGAMHLTLLSGGVDGWTIGFVLVFTTAVGLLAAQARERTASLSPAVATHLAGNIGGVLGGVAYVAVYTAVYGRLPEI